MDNQVIVIVMSFLLLCGVGRSIVYNSKEMVVLQMIFMLVVLMRWKYTKVFFNNMGGISINLMKMNYSIIMLYILGGTGFRRVELMLVLIIIGRLMPIVSSWSGYVVNK